VNVDSRWAVVAPRSTVADVVTAWTPPLAVSTSPTYTARSSSKASGAVPVVPLGARTVAVTVASSSGDSPPSDSRAAPMRIDSPASTVSRGLPAVIATGESSIAITCATWNWSSTATPSTSETRTVHSPAAGEPANHVWNEPVSERPSRR
jgi:hypothetical protein